LFEEEKSKMEKIITAIALAIMILNSGCASYYTHSRWESAQKENAFRVRLSENGGEVGVDLTKLNYLKENTGPAIGAALVDAGLAYGAYMIIDRNVNSSSDSSRDNTRMGTNGRDGIYVRIDGDGNSVDVRGDTNINGL
jgi:hypothetical protein